MWQTQGVRSRDMSDVRFRREDVLVLSECDVSVRLSRGAALITRWLDAESKIMVLGTTSSKWPGLSPPEWPANCPSTLTILHLHEIKKVLIFYWKFLLRVQNDCLVLVNYLIMYVFTSLVVALHFGVNLLVNILWFDP